MSQAIMTIARPYAIAAFEYAKEKQELSLWNSFLEAAALIAQDMKIVQLASNPAISYLQFFQLFCDLLKPRLDDSRTNFLHMLAEYKRLLTLPAIYMLFNTYFEELEKKMHVHVITAVTLDDSYRQKLRHALKQRLHKEIEMSCEVNTDILGGAMIRMGDRVLDGSLRGKLNRLLAFSLG